MGKRSPFPLDPIFFDVELFHGAAWNSLAPDLNQSGATIAHGARSEGSTADASELTFTLRNGDGKYSPRNPMSPLYGLVGRNTPVRARLKMGAPWLDLESANARASRADSAALDITGDIDIRWWGYRDSWSVAADLASKYSTTSNQRSWIWRAEANGTFTLFWSANGSTLLEARSTIALPAWAGEIALGVKLDVNNGSGGRTVTFTYATSLDGPWIPLGDPVVASGTTSLFNSSAPLTLGKTPTSSAFSPPQRVYGFELRNSAGAVVSSFRAGERTAGDTAWFDDQGFTWVTSAASISNAHTIAACEVAEWPMEWGTKGAPSVLTEIEAAGPTRRLGQGEQPLDSAIYQTITGLDQSAVLGYWPMEDGSDAKSFGPAIGAYSTTWSKAPNLATYEGFGGSQPLPELGDAAVRARVRRASASAGVQVRHLLHLPPGGVSGEHRLFDVNFYGRGGADFGVAQVWVNNDGAIRFRALNSDGVDVGGSNWIAFDANGKNVRLSLTLVNNGSAVDYVVNTVEAGGSGLGLSGTVAGRNLDPVRDVLLNASRGDLGATAVGHLTIENGNSSVYNVSPAVLAGYDQEAATVRMSRLSAQLGVTTVIRHAGEPTPLGPQRADTFTSLMEQSASADGGLLHDDVGSIALRYRSLHSLGSQPAVVIPYDDNRVIPFRPSDDDALTRNRVTVSRPNGTRRTVEQTTGPMSLLPPSLGGVGLYDEAVELNVGTDDLVRDTATWRLHVGTWNEGRYPTLGVDLANPYFLANPELTRELIALTPGDRLVVENPPPWLPPFAVDVIVRGIQIAVETHHVRLTWSCVPARPYRMGYWSAGHRWSLEGTVLTASRDETTTDFPVTTPDGFFWTHDDGDYDIVVGGELMTVTDVSAGVLLTVTRSVNGVVKSHPAGAAVALADPSFYAR